MTIAWFSLGISAFFISLAVGLVLIAMGVAMIVKRNRVAELTIRTFGRFSLNGAAGVIIFMSVK